MNKVYSAYLFFYGLMMPMFILFIKGTSFIYVLSLIFVLLSIIINHRKISYKLKKFNCVYILFLGFSFLSTISAVLFNQPDQWKWQAFVFFLYSILLLVVFLILTNESTIRIKTIVRGLRLGLLINIIYGYIQYAIYIFGGLDINDIVFCKILKTVKIASHYYYGELVPTGLTWHPGAYAPILVTAYCMFFNNIIIKLLVIGMAFLTKSSTCTLGIVLCVICEAIIRIQKSNAKVRKRAIIVIIAILISACFAINSGTGSKAIIEIQRLISRVKTANIHSTTDLSTYYHARYYTGLADVIKHANPIQFLFGVGGGCSGYAFVRVFGQYSSMAPWDVESQIVADLISYGLIGFLLMSIWIISIVINSHKSDKRYFVFFVALIIMFFTYNIRFPWVLVLLFIISICLKKGIIIWEDFPKRREIFPLIVYVDAVDISNLTEKPLLK